MRYAVACLMGGTEELAVDKLANRWGLRLVVPIYRKRFKLSKHVARRLGRSHEIRQYPIYSGYGFMAECELQEWFALQTKLPELFGFVQFRGRIVTLDGEVVDRLVAACAGGVYDELRTTQPVAKPVAVKEDPAPAREAPPSLESLIGRELPVMAGLLHGKAVAIKGDRVVVEVNGMRVLLPAADFAA